LLCPWDKLYELIDAGKLKLTNLEATQATTSKDTTSTSTATGGIHMIEEWLDQDDCDEINILWEIESALPGSQTTKEIVLPSLDYVPSA
jgi:hypothetical protein